MGNNKKFDVGQGSIELKVTSVNAELGEFGGVFVHKQPSDTDLGSKAPKEVLLKGTFFATVNWVLVNGLSSFPGSRRRCVLLLDFVLRMHLVVVVAVATHAHISSVVHCVSMGPVHDGVAARMPILSVDHSGRG